jgi:DNA-binding transcriptional regulator WhiA
MRVDTKYIFSEKARSNMRIAHLGKTHSESDKEKQRRTWARIKPINVNYFKKLNIRSAYVLGYLFADGHMHKRKHANGFDLYFTSIDKELIDKIKKEFGIEYRKTRIRYRENGWSNQYIICVSNYYFLQYLIKQGMIYGKKSNRILIPKKITKNKRLFFSFFRGFFDGDGCISSISSKRSYPRVNITTASYKLLIQIKNLMVKFNILSETVFMRKNGRCSRLRFSGRKNVYNLYKLMYQDSNGLFLLRKKQRFDEFFGSY